MPPTKIRPQQAWGLGPQVRVMRQCRETNWVRHIHLIANGRLPRTYSIGCPIGSFGVPHQEAAVSVIMSWKIDSAIASSQPPEEMVSMIPCRPQTGAQRIFARIFFDRVGGGFGIPRNPGTRPSSGGMQIGRTLTLGWQFGRRGGVVRRCQPRVV
jgi:hypothetical protein